MTGEELYWTFEQALDFVVHRDVASVREAPPFFSEHDWSSAVRKGFWALWRAIEARTVHPIKDASAIDPLQWRNDRLAQLEPYEALPPEVGLRPFIVEARKATHRVLIPVADLLKAFPAAGEMEWNPAPGKTKKPPALSDMMSFCSNNTSAYGTAPKMDAALKERFGVRDRDTLRTVRERAGFKGGTRGRPPGSKNKPVKSPRRSK